jgi:hypothetical protein
VRVLSEIFGPKREEVVKAGEDCIMRSSSICTARQMSLGGSVGIGEQVSRMGDMGHTYRILVRKHKVQTKIGKLRRKGENNTEMALINLMERRKPDSYS